MAAFARWTSAADLLSHVVPIGRCVVLVALGCLLSIESAFAQSPTDARYGMVTGVSGHTWTTAAPEDLGPTFRSKRDFGPAFGVYVDGLSSRRIGITVEALLLAAGSVQVRNDGERVDWSFWNLEVPVLAKGSSARYEGACVETSTCNSSGVCVLEEDCCPGEHCYFTSETSVFGFCWPEFIPDFIPIDR